MKTIRIADVTGPVAMATSDGDRVGELVSKTISDGESVSLDFSDVEIVTTSFLNHAIGALLGQFAESELTSRVAFRHLDLDGQERLRRVVENARRYFGDDAYRRSVDHALDHVISG